MIIADAIYYNGTQPDRIFYNGEKVWEKTTTQSNHSISGVWADSNSYGSKNGEPFVYYNKKSAENVNYNPADNTFYLDIEENVTSATEMFVNATREGNTTSIGDNPNLTMVDISGLDFSNVTSTTRMFGRCINLTEIKGLDTLNVPKLKWVDNMFENCAKLTEVNISNFNTASIESCSNLFNGCVSLKKVSLPAVPMIEATNGGGQGGIFWNCQSLEMITNFNVHFTGNSQFNDFYNCKRLTVVTGSPYFNGEYPDHTDLHYCPLDNASAMVFINGLAEITTTQTISFSPSTYDTLTPEQIAVATSKGWNVVRS